MFDWLLKIKMLIISLFLNIGDFLFQFTKGFTVKEILAHRIDTMQTVIFTVLLITGFKPAFQLLTNVIVFVKDTIIGLFFKQRKLKNLAKKEAKQAEKEKLLLQNIENIKDFNKKLKEKMEVLIQKIGTKNK